MLGIREPEHYGKETYSDLVEKIQKHCELGKPVLANGELYFFKDARQNLIDIMDDIDAEYENEIDKK